MAKPVARAAGSLPSQTLPSIRVLLRISLCGTAILPTALAAAVDVGAVDGARHRQIVGLLLQQAPALKLGEKPDAVGEPG